MPDQVFISYSHDSPEHDARVLALADRLRADGIEAMIDQYVDAPPEGWPKWMDRQLAGAAFVLLVCTETYLNRVMGTEQPGRGLGVRWESTLAYQYLYDAGAESTRFIPVLLAGGDPAHIPTPLKGMTYYYPESEEGYEALLRRLTGQPAIPPPPVGPRKTLPPKRPIPASEATPPAPPPVEPQRGPEPQREAQPTPKPQPAPPQPKSWRWLLPLLGLVALGVVLFLRLRPDVSPSAPVSTATPSVVFRSDADEIAPGECTTLHWIAVNVRSVTLDGETVPAEGYRDVCPTTTRSYWMRVEDYSGVFSANSVEIRVSAPSATSTPESATEKLTATPILSDDGNVLTISDPVAMEFVRIPAGEFLMGSDRDEVSPGVAKESPLHTVTLAEFYIGKYEVTNAQYNACVQAKKCLPPLDWVNGTLPTGKEDLPVVNVSWNDAAGFTDWLSAESQKTDQPFVFRLPTEAEWEKACRGDAGRIYPWSGSDSDLQRANYGGVGEGVVEVGTYPRGDSPYGASDMSGNAMEWTSSLSKDYEYDPTDGREDPGAEGVRILRGGTYTDNAWLIRCARRATGLPGKTWSNVGFRVAGSLRESPPALPTDTPTPTPAAEPPEVVAQTQSATPVGAAWVEVPAGEFLMGLTDSDPAAQADEKPQHTVYLDAFRIMQTEVTNAMYAGCVAAGACTPPSNSSSATRPSYYGNPAYADYPVIYVSWDQAAAYCAWAGGRLPSEAEWEKAARGPSTGSGEGRIYPWGDEPPDAQRSNFGGNVGDTTPAGAYPTGASPYGALDMAGNVWEWVNDWYQSDYYSVSPGSNPPGPATGDPRVLRGGDWYGSVTYLHVANRHADNPAVQRYGIGFRCAGAPGP